MKAKCSFILKALTCMVLAVLMLFGTVSTSLAVVVESSGTGAQTDLAETSGWTTNTLTFKGTINSNGIGYSSTWHDISMSGNGSDYYYINLIVEKSKTITYGFQDQWQYVAGGSAGTGTNVKYYTGMTVNGTNESFTTGSSFDYYICSVQCWTNYSGDWKNRVDMFGCNKATVHYYNASSHNKLYAYESAYGNGTPNSTSVGTGNALDSVYLNGTWGNEPTDSTSAHSVLSGYSKNWYTHSNLPYSTVSSKNTTFKLIPHTTSAQMKEASVTISTLESNNKEVWVYNSSTSANAVVTYRAALRDEFDSASRDYSTAYNNGTNPGYTTDSYTAFYNAYRDAADKYAAYASTQTQIDTALSTMRSTFDALVVATTPNITSVTSDNSSLKIGETATITTVLANTSSPTVTYSSSDSTVLSVTKVSNTEATIKALKPGSATITASLSDSGTTDSATTSSISIDTPKISTFSYSPSQIYVNDSYYTASPSKSMSTSTYNSGSTVNYSYAVTSGSSYGSVNSSTGVVTSKSSAGTVTVTLSAVVSYNDVSYTATKTANVTVAAQPSVYLNYGTSDTGTSKAMTYNAAASQAKSSIVYKVSITNLTKNTTYRMRPYDGANDKYSSTNITANTPLSGNGISLTTGSTSNYFTVKTANPSASSAGTYNFYYDVGNQKFYVEYPVQVTYKYTTNKSDSTVKEYAMVEYGGTATTKNCSVTGYSPTSGNTWYNEVGCTSTYDFSTALTADKTLYTPLSANEWTVTLDAGTNGGTIKKTAGDTATGTMTFTHTYGTAETLASQYNTIIPPTGYTLKGWYTTSDGNTTVTQVPSTQNSDITYYAQYSVITGGAVAKAYTDGSASATGGTVKIGDSGTAGASKDLTSISIVSNNKVIATKAAGYSFDGWTFSGDNRTHLMYSFDDSSYTAVPATGKVGTSSDTAIYIKTDGTAGITTANAEVRAMFVNVPYTVSVVQKKYDSATPTNANVATITGASNSVVYNTSVTLEATSITSGYEFDGWYEAGADEDDAPVSTANPYTFTCTDNTPLEARFRKVYYLTFYKTWEYNSVTENFVYRTAPPKKVTITDEQGIEWAVYTYAESTSSVSEAVTRTATGEYNEGDKLKVLAGYSIDAKYGALASSDVIRGAFFNNDIRYTTSNQPDNLYSSRIQQTTGFHEADSDHPHGYYENGDDDWGTSGMPYTYTATTTIYADEDYYIGTEFYSAVHTNSESYKGEISQSAHTVSWTAESDYLNIDIEMADKKKFVFSDYDNTEITCDNTDEFFAIGETVTDHLSVKAAGNADQTNTITLANIKFYYYNATDNTYTNASGVAVTAENRVEIPENTITASLASGTTSVNSGTTAGNTISFSGTMIATDIYVELDLQVTYFAELGTKMVSDKMLNYAAWTKVAKVTVSYDGGVATTNTNYDNSVPNDPCDRTVTKGKALTYTTTFWDEINSNEAIKYSTLYMFLGWYKGDSSGPDYENGLLSTRTTFTYRPSSNVVVYAVGTRNLYIGGSKYLFNDNSDWSEHLMEFDAANSRYYYTIDSTVFNAASKVFSAGNKTDNKLNNNSYKGNSYFKIFDDSNGGTSIFWNAVSAFERDNSDIYFGKVWENNSTNNQNGFGWIAFNTTNSYSDSNTWSHYFDGYDAPITIYAYPATDNNSAYFSIESTYVYQHIYVSNGFNGIDTTTTSNVSIKVNNGTARANSSANDSSFINNMKFNGAGWSPKDGSNYNVEGHVSDITIGAKEATVTLSKTVASASYKISSFVVYDLFNDNVKSYVPTASGTTYTVSIKMQTGHNLYIVPIIESTSANMKVVVDATQLNKTQWGDLVGCYAWYTNGNKAYGAYPGQLMIPSDDGLSLTANFPATNNGASLSGITFSNYLDGEKTWLGGTNVLGTVTTEGNEGSGNIIPTYNLIKLGTNSVFYKTNFKAQTYDYREPVAFYANRDTNAQSFLMNYALKDGNSNIISWSHSDLTGNNIKTYKQTHSDWDDVNFEYLTTADGDTYADMNGVAIDHKPTASFYVVAKGQVIYKNSALEKVFKTGKLYDSPTGITYPSVGSAAGANVTQNYAVQWYVYDANGDFITTMLSAGIADKTTIGGTTSLIGQALLDAGYAIDGRAVAICYDKPRYCYSEANNIPNTGNSFDAYRFTGQWLQQSEYQTAKVYAEVGMMTDNGEELAGSSSAAYGSVTVSINKSKLSYSSYGNTGTTDGVNWGEACIADGDKQAITLTASSMNFAGWYYYNADGDLVKLTEKEEISITPTFSKDVTYYAMYEARATYSYLYQGREGAKSYSVDGGELSEDEMSSSPANTVSKTARTDFGTKTPGANVVSIYKKTITWDDSVEAGMLDNSTAYTMKISNATVTDAKFNLTYHFTIAAGANVDYIGNVENVTFNNVVDLVNTKGLNLNSYAASGKVFKGWYECNSSGVIVNDARPLSTQWNFGQVIVKNTHILAVFGDSYYSGNDTWEVYIDDQEVTREMYTATSGNYYNDVIICARQNKSTLTTLPSGAKVGALFVDDNGTGNTISTDNLSKFANALSASSGKSGKSNGCTVTNMFTDNVTTFGRVDLAVRADYASTVNHKYYVYAYVLIDGTYYFDTTNAYKTGTYE